jgi:hypothetical protein
MGAGKAGRCDIAVDASSESDLQQKGFSCYGYSITESTASSILFTIYHYPYPYVYPPTILFTS